MATETDNFGLREFTVEQLELLSFLPENIRSLLQYHRGFETVNFAANKYYVYTGRGPSKAEFHIGHLPGLQLCLQLQAHIDEKIEFMIADDEKMFRDGIDRKTMAENVNATLKQLVAIGFNETNTNFRINSEGINRDDYEIIIAMLRIISVHTLTSIFGEKTNLGEYFYPLIQILPCFSKTRRCIVIAGVDQDPFFRLARDVARRLGYNPPVIIYTHSVPGLDGSDKMSTSVPESLPIFLGEKVEDVALKVSKIRKVGAGSLDELFEKGANLKEDIPYRLLEIFDTNKINIMLIAKAYTIGLYDASEISSLKAIVPEKGIKERDGRNMLTSFGIRQYLSVVLAKIVSI